MSFHTDVFWYIQIGPDGSPLGESDLFDDAWKSQWPSHCNACAGSGIGASSVEYGTTFTEPCVTCTENGVCARCGMPGLTSEERGDDSTGEGPCKECGWNYDDGIPYQGSVDCTCPISEYEQDVP